MVQFRPPSPEPVQVPPPPVSPAASPAPHWADLLAGLLRQEIDAGRLVRVALPGAHVPILVEDASRWAECLVVADPEGRRYYTASPAGVVVLAEPVAPPGPGAEPYWAKVDRTEAKPS